MSQTKLASAKRLCEHTLQNKNQSRRGVRMIDDVESFWDELLAFVEARSVIPIVAGANLQRFMATDG